MPYKFDQFKGTVERIQHHLVQEFSGLRTGRATPALLDNVLVEASGRPLLLRELGAIGVEDGRTLKVTLWDKSQLKAAEAGILKANLAVTVAPAADGVSVRISFPELSEERRKTLVKLVKEKAEQARISLRREREKVWGDIQVKEKAKELSEDEKFRLKNELQKFVDEANKKIEETVKRKEKEILAK